MKKVKKPKNLISFIYFCEKMPVGGKTLQSVWQGFCFKSEMQLFKRAKAFTSASLKKKKKEYFAARCCHKTVRVSKS